MIGDRIFVSGWKQELLVTWVVQTTPESLSLEMSGGTKGPKKLGIESLRQEPCFKKRIFFGLAVLSRKRFASWNTALAACGSLLLTGILKTLKTARWSRRSPGPCRSLKVAEGCKCITCGFDWLQRAQLRSTQWWAAKPFQSEMVVVGLIALCGGWLNYQAFPSHSRLLIQGFVLGGKGCRGGQTGPWSHSQPIRTRTSPGCGTSAAASPRMSPRPLYASPPDPRPKRLRTWQMSAHMAEDRCSATWQHHGTPSWQSCCQICWRGCSSKLARLWHRPSTLPWILVVQVSTVEVFPAALAEVFPW